MLRTTVLVGSLAMAHAAACAAGSGTSRGGDDDDNTGGFAGNMQIGGGGAGGGQQGAGGPGTGGTGGSGAAGAGGGTGGTTLPCYAGQGGCHPGDTSSCNPGQACAAATDDTWQCFDNGTSPIGGSCSNSTGNPLCVMGALCVNTGSDTCLKLCCSVADCSGSETCDALMTSGSLVIMVCLAA